MAHKTERPVRRAFVRFAVLIVVAVLATACSGGAASPSSAPAASALPAGTYTSAALGPTLTFTLPDGWETGPDQSGYLRIRPAGDEVVGIHLFRDPVAMSQAASCPLEAEPGVGRSSIDLAKWIRERPGLVVGQPAMATVGGLRGTAIDIGIADGWRPSCPFAQGLPTVPLIFQPPDGYRWIVAGSERLRLYLLDVPGGGLVIVDIDAFDGTRWEAILEAAAPIVRSFSFATQ
jgi:hypothetical protein